MTREDIKTVNKEIINRRLLDEYGNNALKIEELEKELKIYNYNKTSQTFAYFTSISTILLGIYLCISKIVKTPALITLPILSLTSIFIGITTEKIINKITKNKYKYTLFKNNTNKIDKVKLEKILEINRLESKNKFLSKAMDILKKKTIFISKKKIKEDKTTQDIITLEELIDNKTYITEFEKTKLFWKNITPESKYILTTGLLSFLSLGFFNEINITNTLGKVLYNLATLSSLALYFTAIIKYSIHKTTKRINEKINILLQRDNELTEKTIVDIDENLIKNLTYDIAYQKVELLEQEIINAVTSKKTGNEYIKEKFKLKEASNKRRKERSPKTLKSNLIIKNKYIYPFKRISN